MKHYFSRVIAVIAMLTAGFAAHASPVIYLLSPVLGMGGSTLTGSITVDDTNADNAVVLSDIVDWHFTSVGGAYDYDFGKAAGPGGANASVTECLGAGGVCFTIVAGELVFDFGSMDPASPSASFRRAAVLNSA